MRDLVAAIARSFPERTPLTPSIAASIATERIGVALSGGVDSLSLMLAMLAFADQQERPLKLFALHFNHAHSPFDAQAQAFVEEFCATRDIALHLGEWEKQCDIKGNLQHAARKARYAFFERAALEHQLHAIALAHHADDQAETFLARAADGAWWDGLSAVPSLRAKSLQAGEWAINYWRPLLGVSREQIVEAAHAENLRWLEDPDNSNLGFQRSRIRHEVLPLIKSTLNKEATLHIASIANQIAELSTLVSDLAKSLLPPRERDPAGDFYAFDAPALHREPRVLAEAALRLALSKLGLGRRDIPHDKIARALAFDARGDEHCELFAKHASVSLEGERLLVARNTFAHNQGDMQPRALDGASGSFEGVLNLTISDSPESTECIWLRSPPLKRSAIQGKLSIRLRQPGDVIAIRKDEAPRPLKRVLEQSKLSIRRALKARFPVICDDAGIVWAGVATAERVLASAHDAPSDCLTLTASMRPDFTQDIR